MSTTKIDALKAQAYESFNLVREELQRATKQANNNIEQMKRKLQSNGRRRDYRVQLKVGGHK